VLIKVSGQRPGRFTPGKEPQYPLYRRLGGPQVGSGRFKEQKNPFLLPGFEPRAIQPVAESVLHYPLMLNDSVVDTMFCMFMDKKSTLKNLCPTICYTSMHLFYFYIHTSWILAAEFGVDPESSDYQHVFKLLDHLRC
jgi:hypothetical protein